MPDNDNYWRHTMQPNGGQLGGRPGGYVHPGSMGMPPADPDAMHAEAAVAAPSIPEPDQVREAFEADAAPAPEPVADNEAPANAASTEEPAGEAVAEPQSDASAEPSEPQDDVSASQAASQPAAAQSAPQPAPQEPAQQPVWSAQSAPQQPTWSAQPAPQQPHSYYGAQPGYQPAYGTADTPAPKSHGWIVAIVIVAAIAGLLFYSMASCSSAIGTFSNRASASSLDGLSRDTVGIINISGTIQYDNSACSPEGLKELLDRAEKNDHIKAVVLRIDSGGGTATAGEEMAEYVRQFSKPVVVSSASINASAAYEISSQADYIFVAKSTEIGAIGTAMEVADLSGLLDKLGVNMETITSAESKDSSYGYRELTDEERAYYQEMVDQINDVFVQNVADGRKMKLEDVQKLATGMPFTGITAIENGLADEVGTREDAVNKAAELGGITGTVEPVNIEFNYYYDLDSLYTLLGSSRMDADDLLSALGEAGSSAHMK